MADDHGIRHPLPSGWLSTHGKDLIAEGHPDGPTYRLAGVNWYGFDSISNVAGGLDQQPVERIAATVARLGFNSVRLPFSIRMVEKNPVVNARFLTANPALRGHRARDIMKRVVHELGAAGLKVILDCHRTQPGWSTQENGVWYDQTYNEQKVIHWIVDLLGKDFHHDQVVVGVDLHNEPACPPPQPTWWPSNNQAAGKKHLLGAAWGFGDPSPNAAIGFHTPWDLPAAYERMGNAVLEANPHLLIFVEGAAYDPEGEKPQYWISHNGGSYWYSGNFLGVRHGGTYTKEGMTLHRNRTGRQIKLNHPNKLVYSPHDYFFVTKPWCQPGKNGTPGTADTPNACHQTFEQNWGFLAKGWTDANQHHHPPAPVWIGEFGTDNGYRGWTHGQPVDKPLRRQRQFTNWPNGRRQPRGAWFTYLVAYIKQHGIHWCYWALNGTQSPAPHANPPRAINQAEGYGILRPDWTDWASQPVRQHLETIM